MKFQCSAQDDFGSALIKYKGAGPFSHVDVIMPDGNLLGARSDAVGGKPPGVQIRPPDYEKFALRVQFQIEATPAQEQAFYDFLKAQEGKPYDKEAILGFVVGRDWRDPSAWFCSELATAAIEASGRCPELYAPCNKVDPVTFATVASALGATVVTL